MKAFILYLLAIGARMGYAGVFILMTIESSFIPLPSEIVIPPAAYLASLGQMKIVYVIIAGVLGSVAGALINYAIAYTLGRKVIYALVNMKWAKFLFLSEDKLLKAEDYFLNYGNSATFIGRLVPAVRHLISIPAGFSKMNLFNFILFTFLGSSVWVSVLAVLGYYFGANKELLAEYYKEISYAGAIMALLFTCYLLVKRKNKIKAENN